MSFTTDFGHSKIDILILYFFKFEFEWNSFTFYFHNNFVQTIDIKDKVLIIFHVLSGGKDNWNFEEILFDSFLDTLFIFDFSDLKG